jgi:hypothetical protein
MKIEKNIPISSRISCESVITSIEMDDGDSVFFKDKLSSQRFINKANRRTENKWFKFSRRKVDGGFRVWKLKREEL